MPFTAHGIVMNAYRIFLQDAEGETLTPVWSGTGLETALMSVDQLEQSVGRLNPRIYLRGADRSEVPFLRSVWYGITKGLDEEPAAIAKVEADPKLLQLVVQIGFNGIGYEAEITTVDGVPAVVLARRNPGTLLPVVVATERPTDEGEIVHAVTIPWLQILRELDRDPTFLYRYAKNPRAFEEFIAACYDRAGWDEVVLTPQRGDLGRDVIAVSHGLKLRYLDQAKAFSPGHVVTADAVRAMWGVFNIDPQATKVIVSTTSTFAPGVAQEFAHVMPYKLELRDGAVLLLPISCKNALSSTLCSSILINQS